MDMLSSPMIFLIRPTKGAPAHCCPFENTEYLYLDVSSILFFFGYTLIWNLVSDGSSRVLFLFPTKLLLQLLPEGLQLKVNPGIWQKPEAAYLAAAYQLLRI